MPRLPDASFDEIAAQLHGFANGAREAANAGAVWADRFGAPGLAHTVAVLDRDAIVAGQLYAFFREAAEHEDLIRDFLAGLDDAAHQDKRGAA